MMSRLEMLKTMLDKGSDDPFVHYAYAMELRAADELRASRDAFDSVLSRFPDYVPSYLMVGQVADKIGDEDAAINYFKRGIECAQRAGDAHAESELRAALAELE